MKAKRFILMLLVMLGSVTGAWAQTVSFEHNAYKAYQGASVSQMAFGSMSTPTGVNTPGSTSDWLKTDVVNHSGSLNEGTAGYQQVMKRHNGEVDFGVLFDWFTLSCTTPAYTQYKYTIHFRLGVDQTNANSVARAALFDYGTEPANWNGRAKTPNGSTSFYTSQNNLTWNETQGDETCAVRLADGTVLTTNTCDVAFTFTSKSNTVAQDKAYFGFSSSRNQGNAGDSNEHNTYLDACFTAECTGYVKHVVYQPNATGIGSTRTEDILNSGTIQANSYSRTGYTFAGWNTQADGTGTTYNAGDGITVDDATKGELVLYAQWTPNTYTVTLNNQGGEGLANIIATYDAAMPGITIPTRTDYQFLGYFTEPNGAGTKYYNGDGTSSRTWDKTSSATLYAHWKLARVWYLDANGVNRSVTEFTTITNASGNLTSGWYIVLGDDVRTGALNCEGAVHLILADGAKLTAVGQVHIPGIRVSAEGASLTIYGQTSQTGKLIASGRNCAAGIGGGDYEDGHDITINGGIITVTGGDLAAGIGGGRGGVGQHITINGGKVTVNSIYEKAPAIGSGLSGGTASNIFVNSSLVMYADGSNPPKTFISHTKGEDVSSKLAGKQYALVREPQQGLIVTLDKQGGTGGTDQITANEGAEMPAITTPTKDGLIFAGYFTGQNGTGVQYYFADGTCANLYGFATNTTLYAHWIENGEPYIDTDGTTKYAAINGEITTTSTTNITTLSSGWYVVRGENITTGTIACDGKVNLILADGAKLTVKGSANDAGIRVSAVGASLTIYGQSQQTGQLIATGRATCAGIGGKENEDGHNITINGGIITATGGIRGAAIGGGNAGSASNITINGGVITASGGNNASAIGGGYRGSSSNIVVNSSLVLYVGSTNPPTDFIAHTNGVDVSDRLSGKQYVIARKQEVSITITFNMQGGTGGTEQITMNEFTEMPDIIIPRREGLFFVGYFSGENGTGTKYYTADGTSAHLLDFTTNTTLYAHWSTPVPYIGVDGETKYVGASEITNTTTTLSSGWYIVNGEVTTGTITCEGYVNLILADGATLTATGGMETAGVCVSAAGASLTIYGQQNQTGQLIATGGDHAAGIGGGRNAEGHDITINGGIITATGGYYGAGIGGGHYAKGNDITINRGVVTVIGGNVAAGIGGGAHGGIGQDITINGGEITVTGGTWGSAIGGGSAGSASNITINGGTITAAGGSEASAIGGGRNGSFSDIFVNASLILKADENATPTTEIEHTSTVDLASALSGKQYATLALPSVAVNRDPGSDVNYGTFYHKYADYTVPNEDANIYTASIEDVQGEPCLVLHKVEGNVIPANTAVILRTEESSVIDLQPCADASGISVPANSLSGANLPEQAPANCYIMSYGQDGFGFYKYAEGKDLAAHKAYLTYQRPASAPARALRMVSAGEVTGIEDPHLSPLNGDDAIYNLSGQRIYRLQKGINIVNGKKVVVK